MVFDGQDLWMVGGGYSDGGVNDQIFKANSGGYLFPVARMPRTSLAASAVWTGSRMLVFGGKWQSLNSHLGVNDHIVHFDPQTYAVTVSSAKLPSPRAHAAAIWDGTRAYVFGGRYGWGDLDEIVRYDPETQTAQTLPVRLPSPLSGMSAIWDGRYVYLFGGFTNISTERVTDQILRFDPTTETIEVLPVRLPYAVGESFAIWTGYEAIIYGGWAATEPYCLSCFSYDETGSIMYFGPSDMRVAVMAGEIVPRLGLTGYWDGTVGRVMGGYTKKRSGGYYVEGWDFHQEIFTHELIPTQAKNLKASMSANAQTVLQDPRVLGDIVLTWDPVNPPLDKIKIYRVINNTGPAKLIGELGPDATSFTDTSCPIGKTCQYQVGTVNRYMEMRTTFISHPGWDPG